MNKKTQNHSESSPKQKSCFTQNQLAKNPVKENETEKNPHKEQPQKKPRVSLRARAIKRARDTQEQAQHFSRKLRAEWKGRAQADVILRRHVVAVAERVMEEFKPLSQWEETLRQDFL